MVELAAITQQTSVEVNVTLPGLVALAPGIVILVFPEILNYVVAASP